MLQLTLTSLWARRRRVASICVAVALGVAFLTGTLVLGDTLSQNFDRLFTDASAGTDVVVRNATSVDDAPDANRGLIDASLVTQVERVEGVARADGQVVGYGSLLGRDGNAIGGNGPPRLAGSWISSPKLNPYHLVSGRAPRADDEVVVNRGAAQSGNLHLGDFTTVQTPDPVRVHIVGIATFGDADGLGMTTWTAFTLASAQAHVTHDATKVSAILVQAAPGVSSSTLQARIRAELPRGVDAITGAQLTQERTDAIATEFLDMLRAFLVVFAVIALIVAALTITNTFSIVVAQRTGELALLRAVGASRRQVRWAVSLEAALIGGVAAAIGVVAGLGVAGLLARVFDAFGGSLPSGGLDIQPTALAIGFAAGLVVTLVAAQLPGRRAATIPPIAALRAMDSEPRTLSRRRITSGVAVLVVGIAGALAAALAGGLVLGAAAASVLVVAGTLLLTPVALGPTAAVLGAGLRRVRGVSGFLAEENARRNPRRSASTATALVVGVAVVALITVLVASLKTTLDTNLSAPFRADLVVNTSAFGGNQLSPRAVDALARLPQVDQAVGTGEGTVRIGSQTTTVTNTDLRAIDHVVDVGVVHGALTAVGDQGMAVSRTKADDEGWTVGSSARFTFADGATQRVTVGAVYDDNDLLGDVVIPTALWNGHTAQPTARSVFVTTTPGVTTAAARHAIEPVATRFGGDVQDRAQYVDSATGGLDFLLGIVYVLLLLAIVIALFGIANTLSLAVYERRREIGLLRAVGQTRRQVRAVLRLESVIIATFGTLVGVVLGSFLGWSVFAAIAQRNATPDLPVAQLAVILVVGALAGVLAGWRPARRASRVAVLDAITAR
jgi:putative ABC transport system permease protein